MHLNTRTHIYQLTHHAVFVNYVLKKGPKGVCEFVDESRPQIDKSKYKGIRCLY